MIYINHLQHANLSDSSCPSALLGRSAKMLPKSNLERKGCIYSYILVNSPNLKEDRRRTQGSNLEAEIMEECC